MHSPVRPADLVADEAVGGRGIGDAQERLRQTEKRDPLGGIEPILLQKPIDPPRRLRRPQIGKQAERAGLDAGPRRCVEGGCGQQRGEHVGFGRAVKGAHRGDGGGECRHRSAVERVALAIKSMLSRGLPARTPTLPPPVVDAHGNARQGRRKITGERCVRAAMTLENYRSQVGTEVGVSDWVLVDQARIDAFAECTGDHQFIHVDPERAKATPFGTTIAHGYLTLSLIPMMTYAAVPSIEGAKMGVNYGMNKLRFVAPVKSGKRVRGRFTLVGVEQRPDGSYQSTMGVTVEIEGETKPALVGESVALIYL